MSKINLIKENSIAELNLELVNSKKKLHLLNLSKSVKQIENPSEIRNLRKLIARLNTVINQKSLIQSK